MFGDLTSKVETFRLHLSLPPLQPVDQLLELRDLSFFKHAVGLQVFNLAHECPLLLLPFVFPFELLYSNALDCCVSLNDVLL